MANPSAAELASEREFVITRVFDVPARFLFAAYSTREHLMKWFGPKEWPVSLCELDFRVGGKFRMQMTGPGGQKNTPFGGTYREIVPERKIVFDNGFEEPGAERMVVTVTFDEQGGKTTLTMHTLFDTVKMKELHLGHGFDEGTNSALDQLGDVARELRRRDS